MTMPGSMVTEESSARPSWCQELKSSWEIIGGPLGWLALRAMCRKGAMLVVTRSAPAHAEVVVTI